MRRVRAGHYSKTDFMLDFEALSAGATRGHQPSFFGPGHTIGQAVRERRGMKKADRAQRTLAVNPARAGHTYRLPGTLGSFFYHICRLPIAITRVKPMPTYRHSNRLH